MRNWIRCLALYMAVCGFSAMAADFVIPPQPQQLAPTPPTAPPPSSMVPQPVTATLNDGSVVEFDADGTVMVIDKGNKFQAPDGTMTLRDGTPFTVKDGKRVDE